MLLKIIYAWRKKSMLKNVINIKKNSSGGNSVAKYDGS